MLLRVYEDADLVRSIAEDPDAAPIPEAHKVVYRWTGKLVHEPWAFGIGDIAQLRGLGLAETDIAHWAVRGTSQSWFTMCADGAGVDLDGGALVGPAVGRARAVYKAECRPDTKRDLGSAEPGSTERRSESAWIETLERGEVFEAAASRATESWGCVPHILRAVSLQPEALERHAYMLELLEQPQSKSLPPRTHALVRAAVAKLNQSIWAQPTIEALLDRHASHLESSTDSDRRIDDLAIDLATKLVRTPWKVTEKDAIGFRDAGLDDAAYLDVLDTTAIQNALDRLTWALGVPADPEPLLPTS
jgi:alkylhydroperoxidase family enzyme